MSTHTNAALLLCSLCLAQAAGALAQQPAASTLVVPGSTIVPLTLVNPIKSRSTKPGDSIRAVVAFPFTVDGQVAIPEGTYVEGTLALPLQKVKHQADPDVRLHLTRLVFATGYTAPIDATQAKILPPAVDPNVNGTPETAQTQAASSAGNAFVSGQTAPSPTLPPLHSTGPSPGTLAGVGIGVVGVITTIGVLNRHHARNSDYIVHDAGWQFQMKLESPLTLDANRIALPAKEK